MRRLVFVVLTALLVLSVVSVAPATANSYVVSARQHVFGAENVDPRTGEVRSDRVILSWVSVATLAASIRGHVVLLDTYIHKREDQPNYVPTTLDELVALDPSHVFIGHGHFDHADTAGEIAVRTGATVVGTAEHCAQTRGHAEAYGGPGTSIDCRSVIPAGAAPGYRTDKRLMPGVDVSAIKHVHSAAEPPDPDRDVTNVVLPVPDAGSVLLHPPGPGAFAHSPEGDEGGSVLYQFRVRDFALTWHDSSGPLKEQAPEVFDRLRALPPTDVQAGAVLGFNQLTNGLRDPAMYVDALCPQVFIPLHHDFVTEYGSADDYEAPMRRELEFYGASPRLRWLVDPHDYLRPELMTFDPNVRAWREPSGPGCG
ncbi:MAG: MBL fold metallo-hydrolase [Actinophytocola sp.]|nr:MBL fold metallo-hydrolase [Actinophytocola sp.]